MKRFFIGSAVAALVLLGFRSAFWTCPIPYAYVEKPSSSKEALQAALREHLPNDGVYLVPGFMANPAEAKENYRKGPIATIHYRREGLDSEPPPAWLTGFLHAWVTTALLASLLRMANLPRYGQRVILVSLAGLAAVNYMKLGDGIFWFQPWPWLILNASFDAAAILMAALVLAALIPADRSPRPIPDSPES